MGDKTRAFPPGFNSPTGSTTNSALMASYDLSFLPQIDLRQFLVLTDDTGMLQHAAFLTPDPRYGYCTDDNARALIVAILHARLRGHDENPVPLQRYLSFLSYAFNRHTGRFRNFMAYDRKWMEEIGSEDSHARAVWALGAAVHLAPNNAIRELADQLLHQALPALESFEHFRPWAFGVIGLEEYLKGAPETAPIARIRSILVEALYARWKARATRAWPWWEDILTWGNARLPHALLLSGHSLGRPDFVDSGLQALDWLLNVQTAEEGHLSIVGNRGWFKRNGARAQFDQQPLEACALVHACLVAAEVTRDERWISRAIRCFEWFLGKNDLGLPLYNPETGGCHDGLTPNGVNKNQGAESTLAYLLSLLALHRVAKQRRTPVSISTTDFTSPNTSTARRSG